jgi:drug/metabolite transporter (DMT)-like permease
MPAALESSILMGVMGVVSGVLSLHDRGTRRAALRDWAWLAWLGVSDALNVLLFFAAYKLTITIAVLTHYLTPIFVAIAAPLVLRERLGGRTVIAVGVSLSGLALMLARSGVTAASDAWTSAALGAGSAVFYASNVIGNKFIANAFSTSEAVFWHTVVAAPLLAAFVPRSAWGAIDPHAALFLAVASIGPGALAGLTFLWGLRRMPAAHASTLTLIEPLVAVLLGAAVFGEALGWRTIVGGGLILGGAVVVITQGQPAPPAAGVVPGPGAPLMDE